VSAAMRARVEQATADLGYEPDLLAQSLRRGSTRTVGFVLRDISNPLFANIARGCEQVLRRSNYSMLITSSDGSVEAEAVNLALLRRRRVDGVIVSLVSETAPQARQALSDFAVPIVLLDREVEGFRCSAVLCDHYSGVRQATEELLARGHRRIALVSGSLDVRSSRERRRGYIDAYAAAGFEPPEDLTVFGEFDPDFAKAQLIRMLPRAPSVTAVLTGGLGTTAGALRALRQLRKEPGKDVALVALDEWPDFDVFAPWLSSVTRDSGEMGTAAAALLLDLLNGAENRVETIDTVFKPRDSLGPRLTGDNDAVQVRSRVAAGNS
jgi:LacI family transcriptional regulator